MTFNKFIKFVTIISSIIFPFLSFPSGISIMCMLVLLMVSHTSLRVCSLFFILFALLLRLGNFNVPYLQVCWFFLLPTQIFWLITLMLFRSRISIWLLFIIFISLLILYMYSYTLLLILFSFLSMVSFSFLSIFKTVYLSIFLVSLMSGFPQGWFLSISPSSSFLLIGHTFLFLCILCNFIWELGILNVKVVTMEIRSFHMYGLLLLLDEGCSHLFI